MILAVAASPSVDITYVVDALNPGEVHRPRQTIRLAGGKGINVARVVGALGGEVVASGIVAGASGRWFVEELEREGVVFLPVLGSAETRTCVSIADPAAGRSTEVYEPASPVLAAEWSELEETVAAEANRQHPRWITLSGSLPAGAPAGAVARLIDIAHRTHARLAVDTQGAALIEAMEFGADLVKVNAAEAAEAIGAGVAATPQTLCESIHRRAPRTEHVVVTAGARGAYASSSGREMALVRPGDPGDFTAGCGDAFLAGLVHALASGDDIEAALRLASSVASANAQVPGAGRLDPMVVR